MGIVLDDGVPVFIGPALEGLAAFAVVHHHRADATAFLAAHDADINHTVGVEFLPGGELTDRLRITQQYAQLGQAVQHTVEMRGPIPGWWRP